MLEKSKVISVDNLPLSVKRGASYSILQSNPNNYTHGMFKYPCKFIPEIPRWAINKYLKNKGEIVLDPFTGSGTTPVEALINGYDCYGTEIDETAKLISKVKTTPLSSMQIEETENIFNKLLRGLNDESIEPYRPQIRNIEHWFSSDALNKLGRARIIIDGIEDREIADFMRVCFISIIKRTSNADDFSPKPFVSKNVIKVPEPVEKEFASVFKKYINGMREYSSLNITNKSYNLPGHALDFKLPVKADLAVTSPPYINAFDYARTMRLENIWLGFMSEEDIRSKKKDYVGTENINTNIEESSLAILNKSGKLKKYYDLIYKVDKKRALIVKKFFEDMEVNLKLVYDQLKTGGHYVIVIGNSDIRKVNVESWRVIREIAENIGYVTETYFSYTIKNHYIRIPRGGRGGKINDDHVLVLKRER